MTFYIDLCNSVDRRTEKQNAQLDALYAANKILKAAGFNTEVVHCMVFDADSRPGYIAIVDR